MSSDIRSKRQSPNGDEDASHIAAQALQFIRLCYRWADANNNSTQLVSISIYPPNSKHGGDWLVVGKGFSGGYRLVAFHRSPNPFKALLGFLQKVGDQTIVWKEDAYAQTNNEWLKR